MRYVLKNTGTMSIIPTTTTTIHRFPFHSLKNESTIAAGVWVWLVFSPCSKFSSYCCCLYVCKCLQWFCNI